MNFQDKTTLWVAMGVIMLSGAMAHGAFRYDAFYAEPEDEKIVEARKRDEKAIADRKNGIIAQLEQAGGIVAQSVKSANPVTWPEYEAFLEERIRQLSSRSLMTDFVKSPVSSEVFKDEDVEGTEFEEIAQPKLSPEEQAKIMRANKKKSGRLSRILTKELTTVRTKFLSK